MRFFPVEDYKHVHFVASMTHCYVFIFRSDYLQTTHQSICNFNEVNGFLALFPSMESPAVFGSIPSQEQFKKGSASDKGV